MTIVEPSRRLGAVEATRVRLPLAGDDPDALFGLPANLHLLGTMNTADRSIALMDVALRRRFEFVEVMPQPSLLRHHLPADVGALAAALLTTINERIDCLLDRDHLIGHAALMGATSREDLRDWLATQVIPLLQEYFYGDWSRVALVLGCPFDQKGQPVDTKTDARLLVPQGGSTAKSLFYDQWRDPAPLRLMVNPALANATGEALDALLRGVLTPDQRGL
jgi:5-methylcytosine-specific restriction enzyme B